MEELRKLPGIGKVAAAKLILVGIDTPEKLRQTGSKEAFIRIRAIDPTACLNMFYALGSVVTRWNTHLSADFVPAFVGFPYNKQIIVSKIRLA